MPTHKTRYEGQFFSSNGRIYLLKIYDKNYTSATVVPITIGGGGVKIKYDTKGQEKFSPIIASKCSISLVVENNAFGLHLKNFIKDLRETYEEGDATVVIWNTGSTSDTPLWSGNILIDLSSKEDVSLPYEVELNATDGLGLLRNYDMVSVQGSSPYASADTYISDGYQTFIYWIKTILEYCNTPDSDSTDGDVVDYTFSTAINWWYENHPAADPSVSPLAYTQCQMLASYEVTDDLLYKSKSVYEILESFCKMWGMRVVFWKNTFYFTQVELYNTADTGTFTNPENIDSQIWKRNGAFSSSQDYLGNTHFSLYSQDIETNAGGFKGGLQKLAGSTWDYYPKLKQVTAEFQNISNSSYYTGFPSVVDATGQNQNIISSSVIGTLTGASSFSGFLANFVLNIDASTVFPGNNDIIWNWSIRAKQTGAGTWAKYWVSPSTGWATYPGAGAGFNAVPYRVSPHTYSTTTIQNGNYQETIFNGVIDSDAAFTGDWDFELFTLIFYVGTDQSGANDPVSYGNFCVNWYNLNFGVTGWDTQVAATPTYYDMTYQDAVDSNGNLLSYFKPILNQATGGNIDTSVISSRSETQLQEIKEIWWGDTIANGEPASLIWDNGAGTTGYTDPEGLWRNGQSATFNKTITELLCEARLFNQQQSDYKWSLSTAVSETNRMINDGTGARPVYINPIGRIHDTVDEIFYYLLRGTFNILYDEWEGEWLQVSYDDGISITTTQTGGSSPTNPTSSAKLAPPSTTAHINPQLVLTSLPSILSSGTITSIPIADQQITLSIKNGDKITLFNGMILDEFTVDSDVESDATTISVESKVTTVDYPIGTNISLGGADLFTQYQHKTRGTINISEYSFTERSTDPYFPSTGNAVMWMSDGTASGDDGDMLITINTGAALTTSKFDLTAVAANPFTFTIDTTASGSASDTFVLPLVNDGTISILVNWGDGNSDIITTYNQTEITHQYSAGGTYSVTMQGTIRGFRFADAGDKAKMRVVSQWGDLKITQTMAFKGCIDMTCSASDAPTILDTTDLDSTFYNCTDLTNIGGAWDMAGITSLDSFFYQCSVFNQDISAWDVSSCTNFDNLFFLNVLFNQNIGGWNTGAATTMVDMLDGNPSGAFDQDISSWDIADVTDFGTNFMRGQTLSTANYDALLIAWNIESVQSGLTLDFGNSKYTDGADAATARANLISADSWTISDGGAATPAFSNVYSLDFDGVDDYMNIADAASVISGATGSISFWFKGTSISGGYFFEFKVDANNYFQSYYAFDVVNSTRRAGGSNDSAVSFGGGSGDDGNWHHAAYTWSESADEFIAYADGVAETTRTSIGTWAGTPSIFTIARYDHWSGGYLDGNIDEISIFSSALSAAEVTAIYNSGAPTDLSSETDLVGYWRNGDPDGTSSYPTISDDSTNSNDGTMTNMASGDIVEDVP